MTSMKSLSTFNLLADSYSFADVVQDDDKLFLAVCVLAVLLLVFVIAINIARIKNVFFKFSKTTKGRIAVYRFIKFYFKYRSVIWYLIFGCCTLVITVLTKNFMHFITFGRHPYMTAAVAWILATSFSFIANKLVVFESYSNSFRLVMREILSFFGARGVSLALDFFLIWLFNVTLGINYTIVALISWALQVVINYLLSKNCVFNVTQDVIEDDYQTAIDSGFESEFIPAFSKDDDFLKYLYDEDNK